MRKIKKLLICLLFLMSAILLISCQDKYLASEKYDENSNTLLIIDGEIIEDVGKIESEMIKNDEILDYIILEDYTIFETVENNSLKIEVKDMQIREFIFNSEKELPDYIKSIIEENPYLVYFNCKITNISGIDREDEVYNATLVDSEGHEYLGSFVNDSGFIVQLNNDESIDGHITFNIPDIENKLSSIEFKIDGEDLKIDLPTN